MVVNKNLMKFNYFIQRINESGWATIEYSNEELGSTIKSFYLPIHKSSEYIKKYIISQTPRKEFLARENKKKNLDLSNLDLENSYETSLEDNWYEERLTRTVKKELIKLPEFLIWIFKMNKGDYKFFKHDELTRNMELPKDLIIIENFEPVHPIYPIAVFVRGSFLLERPGKEGIHIYAGKQMTFEYGDYENGNEVNLLSLEDDSEYHCLTPRSKEPKFWKRKIRTYSPGSYSFKPIGFLYVAKGFVLYNSKTYSDRSLITMSQNSDIIIEKESIIAEVWE